MSMIRNESGSAMLASLAVLLMLGIVGIAAVNSSDSDMNIAHNYRSDITDTFDIKIKALGCHKSQVGNDFPPEMEKRLRDRAKDFAKGEGFELAEAFHRVEILW